MKKILFFGEGVSLAHIGRPLQLALWAKKAGYEVHLASSKAALDQINANKENLATHQILTVESAQFYKRVNQGKFFYTKKELQQYIDDELRLINQINPDYIVSDFRLTTAISAKLANIPLLNLSNAHWSPNADCLFPAPNSHIFKWLPSNFGDFIFNLIRPYAFKFFGKEMHTIRKKFDLKALNDFREIYTAGDKTAYMDLPNFFKTKNLPASHFFLGPVVWSPECNQDITLEKSKEYVYISMGSSGDKKPLQTIISTVLSKGYDVILSGISPIERRELVHAIPALKTRGHIKSFIRPENILRHCALTVCHGGSGTVYQSLSKGVPVLCLAHNCDQGLVSLCVSQNNLGRSLPAKLFSQKKIDTLIEECITNECIKQSAQQFQKSINKWDTESQWCQFLSKELPNHIAIKSKA